MENAVDALKIAFAVIMFGAALALSISSFSNASSAVDSIVSMRDRENEYTYVQLSENLTRTVGIETVVTSMYRAFDENTVIYFVNSDGKTPLALYYATDTNGNIKKDDSYKNIEISCIDLSKEGFATKEQAVEHLNIVLGGKVELQNKSQEIKDKYKEKLIYRENGLYEQFKEVQFEELLGEYYQGEGASQIKRRVITYRKLP